MEETYQDSITIDSLVDEPFLSRHRSNLEESVVLLEEINDIFEQFLDQEEV